MFIYVVSKVFVLLLIEVLFEELKGINISVSVFCFGLIKIGMVDDVSD